MAFQHLSAQCCWFLHPTTSLFLFTLTRSIKKALIKLLYAKLASIFPSEKVVETKIEPKGCSIYMYMYMYNIYLYITMLDMPGHQVSADITLKKEILMLLLYVRRLSANTFIVTTS